METPEEGTLNELFVDHGSRWSRGVRKTMALSDH